MPVERFDLRRPVWSDSEPPEPVLFHREVINVVVHQESSGELYIERPYWNEAGGYADDDRGYERETEERLV